MGQRVAHLTARKAENLVDLRMASEEIVRQILDEPGDVQRRIGRADQMQGGKRPEHVAHGSEADEEHAVVILQAARTVVHEPTNLTPSRALP